MLESETAIEHSTGYIETSDGLRLYAQSYSPSQPKGVVCLVHGLAEHSGRYEHVAHHLVENDWACSMVDLRGHGRSDGRRVHIDRHEDWSIDLEALRDFVDQRHGDLPKVLLGHSMGGLISLVEACERPASWKAVVVSSPALAPHPDAEPAAWLHRLALFLSRWTPRIRIASDLDSQWISRDPEVVAAYQADRLVTKKVTPRWYSEFLQMQIKALELAPKWSLPTLVMQSSSDRLADPQTSRRWAERAPDSCTTFKSWPGLFHEMFNEPEKQEVLTYLVNWLNRLAL